MKPSDKPPAIGSSPKAESSTRMDQFQDLPEKLLFTILLKTSPQDVAKLSVVSKKFEAAAKSDIVWNAFLPTDAREIAQNVHGGPLAHESAKDLYHKLASFVVLGDGTKAYGIDRKTGGVYLAFSGRALQIAHGDNPQHWTYGPREGSRFPEVACLEHVWWLDLSNEMKVKLPPGEYTVWWILQLASRYKWADDGIKFHVTADSGQEMSMETKDVHLSRSAAGWVAYDGGTFEVRNLDEVDLRVSMENKNCNYVKSGMWVDGIIVQLKDLSTPAASNLETGSGQAVYQLSAMGSALEWNSSEI